MLRPASDEQWGRLRADVARLVARRVPTSADVEDIAQEVLLRVWRHGDELRDDERFAAWLSRIAHTSAADHMRDRLRHPVPKYEAGAEETAAAEPPPDEPQTKELILMVLRPFVESLPEPYRETIALSELEGLSHATIAERLGISVSGVKSRVQRGRTQLREMLDRCCAIAVDARGTPMSCEVRPDGELPEGCCGEGASISGRNCS